MYRLGRWLVAGVGLVLLAGFAVRAEEEKVPLDKVPKAVLDTVKAKFEGAELVGASKETEDGKTTYEVTIKHRGTKIDVELSPDGKILVIEKTIAFKDLPRPVAEAVNAKYPRATIKKTEELTKDATVSYEVLLVTADKKKVEVVLDGTGKIIQEEQKKEKEKKDKDKK
jgi:uncharacterized membrane protein YkoI